MCLRRFRVSLALNVDGAGGVFVAAHLEERPWETRRQNLVQTPFARNLFRNAL
jgi:hypothetical protein